MCALSSSLVVALEDAFTLCGMACQHPHLRSPALAALELLASLPDLPAAEGDPLQRVASIVASAEYQELANFFLLRGVALVSAALPPARAPEQGARAGTVAALAWVKELGRGLLAGVSALLQQPVCDLLPAEKLKRGAANWMDVAVAAWDAGAERKICLLSKFD